MKLKRKYPHDNSCQLIPPKIAPTNRMSAFSSSAAMMSALEDPMVTEMEEEHEEASPRPIFPAISAMDAMVHFCFHN